MAVTGRLDELFDWAQFMKLVAIKNDVKMENVSRFMMIEL
jgi:hypothetical protein